MKKLILFITWSAFIGATIAQQVRPVSTSNNPKAIETNHAKLFDSVAMAAEVIEYHAHELERIAGRIDLRLATLKGIKGSPAEVKASKASLNKEIGNLKWEYAYHEGQIDIQLRKIADRRRRASTMYSKKAPTVKATKTLGDPRRLSR